MRKSILLLLIIFMVTGCSVQYNLEINSSSVKENTNIKFAKETFDGTLSSLSNYNMPITQDSKQVDFYNLDVSEDAANYYLKYNYEFDHQKYVNSYFVKNCYETVKLEEKYGQIHFYTSSQFRCINLDDGGHIDSATINIKTDMRVIENNADEIKDNIYTWKINEKNSDNKPINIVMEKNDDIDTLVNNTKDMLIILGAILIPAALIGIYMVIRKKRSNSI